MRVRYLAQEHNAVPRPGLEPGPFDPESSALTISHCASHLHKESYRKKMNLKINEFTCTSTATNNIMVTAIKAVEVTNN